MVLVRDMWLTGFDAPSLHTMYVDKPMQGHNLFQAITRVNRVFKDKPGGLVVDYLGLANDLKKAVDNYSRNGGRGDAAFDKADAIAVMLEKHEVCCAMFHGFYWSKWTSGNAADRLTLIPAAQEHILGQDEGKERFTQAVMELTKAFTLSVPADEAINIRDDVNFFQTVRAAILKKAPGEKRSAEDLDSAIKQIVSRAVASEGVVDIFAEAGLRNPDISVLSDEFLSEVKGMTHRSVAVELLQKLIRGELSTRRRQNVIQARSFAEMLEDAIRRYQNRTIEAAQVIEELIELARQMREDLARGEELGLNEDELAFYDALETNDSAVQVLGDETLRTIAQELVETVRRNATIDWTVRESVRAGMRNAVRRVLRKHGYPPDKQDKAIEDGDRTGGVAVGGVGKHPPLGGAAVLDLCRPSGVGNERMTRQRTTVPALIQELESALQQPQAGSPGISAQRNFLSNPSPRDPTARPGLPRTSDTDFVTRCTASATISVLRALAPDCATLHRVLVIRHQRTREG